MLLTLNFSLMLSLKNGLMLLKDLVGSIRFVRYHSSVLCIKTEVSAKEEFVQYWPSVECCSISS
jgi:hypothetical protein